jgi:hypothetical protein
MLKKAAVSKLKDVAISKAGQAISGLTDGAVPSTLGSKIAQSAASKAMPKVFAKNGAKMKVKKRKKRVYKRGGGPVDPTLDARAEQGRGSGSTTPRKKTADKAKPKTADNSVAEKKGLGFGLSPKGGGGMGSVFAEDQLIGSLDMGPAPKKKTAQEVQEKSEEAAKERPSKTRKTKEERKERRQELLDKAKGLANKGLDVAEGFRDRYEKRAARNKHHRAAMTAMSSYEKGGKMNPTDPKKKIKSMLEGGASDKEINAYLKKQGIDKTHDVTWDNVEMKVTMKPKKGDFGEPDKPGQRSDNFKYGGKAPGPKNKKTVSSFKKKKSGVNSKKIAKAAIAGAMGGATMAGEGVGKKMAREGVEEAATGARKKRVSRKFTGGGSVKNGRPSEGYVTDGGVAYKDLSYQNKQILARDLGASINAAKSSRFATTKEREDAIANAQAKYDYLQKFMPKPKPKPKPTTKARFKRGGRLKK